MKIYHKLLIILTLFIIGCSAAPPTQTKEPITPKMLVAPKQENASIKWNKLDDRLMIRAAKEGKFLFIYVRTETCGFCKKMERVVFKNKSVIKLINSQYVSILVDTERDEIETMILFPKQEVRVPAFIFINLETKPWTIVKASGYHSTISMVQLLQAVENELE